MGYLCPVWTMMKSTGDIQIMQTQRLSLTRFDGFLRDVEEYALIGWQDESTDLGNYMSLEKHQRTYRKPFAIPHRRPNPKKNPCKHISNSSNRTITSHLFCPEIAKVTSIKFMSPKDQHAKEVSDKNTNSIISKHSRTISRVLIELPGQIRETIQSKNFLLSGERSRYYSKMNKSKLSPNPPCWRDFKQADDSLILSLTLPSFKQQMSKTLQRPVKEWFGGSRDSVLARVGGQIRCKRSSSLKATL